MKINRLLFLLLTCMMILSSCHPVLKKLYGVHDPRLETKTSIQKYLHKKKINANNILVTADSTSLIKAFLIAKDLPDLRVFDKNDQLVIFKDSAACNAPGFDFTEHICDGKVLPTENTNKLSEELKLYRNLADYSPVSTETNHPDFTVFIFWGKFAGRLNKDHVRVWENNLLNQKSCSIRIYKVDLDIIEGLNNDR